MSLRDRRQREKKKTVIGYEKRQVATMPTLSTNLLKDKPHTTHESVCFNVMDIGILVC